MRSPVKVSGYPERSAQLRWQALAEAALVFLGTLWYFRWKLLQWNGSIDFDGHYHFKVAQWIAKTGFWFDIPWLPFTVLGEQGPDYVWFWHLTLIPFTWFADPAEGLVWATAFNGAATAGVLALVMRMLGVPGAPMFAVLAISASVLMPYRLMMLRGQNIAIVFTVLSVWAMARGRHKTLAVLAFLFMQSYHAAVILGPIAAMACALQSARERRLVLAPLLAVAAGELLALVLSPWFPRHIEYLIFHLLYKQVVHGEYLSSLVGSEWYPPGWRNILQYSWPTHLMLGAALAFMALRVFRQPGIRPAPETLLAIGVAFLALGLQFSSVRYVEYYVPFAVLGAGLVARDHWPAATAAWWRRAALAAWMLVAARVGFAAVDQVTVVPSDYLAKIGERLNALGRPGEIVFNSAWTEFTVLLWHADRLRYVAGLDGHYLAYRDPGRFALWIGLASGTVADPVDVLVKAFGARFVVVSPPHRKLAQQLAASDRAILQIESQQGWLFEIPPGGK